MSTKLREALEVLAKIPIEDFNKQGKPDYPLMAWNSHELKVSHVLEARAALAETQPSGDYVMVPREPTQAMIDAAKGPLGKVNDILAQHQIRYGQLDLRVDGEYPLARAYKAMLAAARQEKCDLRGESSKPLPHSGA